MLDKMTIFIIIPVFNHWEHTKKCLESLRLSRYKNLKIIVVDHGSTDQTKDRIAKDFSEVQHLIEDDIHWWAGATNIGVRSAIQQGASQIMLLNNDCYVTPNTIEILVEQIGENTNSIIAPVQIYKDNGKTIIRATTCFLLGLPTLRLPSFLLSKSDIGGKIKTKLIIGGRGVLIPRAVFEEVGFLDQSNLPHYGSDHDFFIRCRKAGVKLYVSIKSIVYIDNVSTSLAATSAKQNIKWFKNVLKNRRSHVNLKDISTLFKKHYPIKFLYPLGVFLYLTRYFLFSYVKTIFSSKS